MVVKLDQRSSGGATLDCRLQSGFLICTKIWMRMTMGLLHEQAVL